MVLAAIVIGDETKQPGEGVLANGPLWFRDPASMCSPLLSKLCMGTIKHGLAMINPNQLEQGASVHMSIVSARS